MKKTLIFCVIGVILISAITAMVLIFRNKENKKIKPTNQVITFAEQYSIDDDFAFGIENNKLYFWDFVNNTQGIFCSQPNCTHQTLAENKNSTCTAVPVNADYTFEYVFNYNDKLYSICRYEFNKFFIYESDMDG